MDLSQAIPTTIHSRRLARPFGLPWTGGAGCERNSQSRGEGCTVVNNATFQVVLQVVSVLAVAGGLIYAALQFRGWRTAQYVANFTTLVELQLQLRKMVVDDPALATLGAGLPPETAPDEIRGNFYNLMQVSLFEIAWFSHQHGQLPHDYFASWVANMAVVAQHPAFRTMWQSDRTKILHVGFRQYMNALLEDSSVCAPVQPGSAPLS